MNENMQIRVPMAGGFLVAERNGDPDHDGISIMFETTDGTLIDITCVECKSEFNRTKIDVYNYEDAYDEDMTRKYTIDVHDIYNAIGEEENSRIIYASKEA